MPQVRFTNCRQSDIIATCTTVRFLSTTNNINTAAAFTSMPANITNQAIFACVCSHIKFTVRWPAVVMSCCNVVSGGIGL